MSLKIGPRDVGHWNMLAGQPALPMSKGAVGSGADAAVVIMAEANQACPARLKIIQGRVAMAVRYGRGFVVSGVAQDDG